MSEATKAPLVNPRWWREGTWGMCSVLCYTFTAPPTL